MLRLKNLQQLVASYAGLNAALQKISQPTLPSAATLKAALAELENCRTNPAASVRQKAEAILPLASQLAASHRQLDQAVRLVRELRFREAIALKPGLPAPEECMVDARLFDFRKNLEGSWSNFKTEITVVSRLMDAFTSRISSLEAEPRDLIYWRDAAALEKIFQCDSLGDPFPKRTRTEPVGEYDRAVGIEFFYGWLKALGSQNLAGLQAPPFETRVMAARTTVAAARAIVNYFPTPNDKPYLQDGLVKQWVEKARHVLSLRDEVAGELNQRSKQTSGRTAIIAGGVALQLLDETDSPFAKNIAAQLTALRSAVVALNNQRDSAAVARRIEIRKNILQMGLPGDPLVNQMWIESLQSAGSGGL